VECCADDAIGYAWHGDERRRACFTGGARGAPYGTVAAHARLVSAAIDGRHLTGVERLLAIQALERASPIGLRRLFLRTCIAPGCDACHFERASRALRALAEYVHPDAVLALWRAGVPEKFLVEPTFMTAAELATGDPRRVRYLPVWRGDDRHTFTAQIAFAGRYAARRGRWAAYKARNDDRLPEWLDENRDAL
jgi:hypothetical protein